MERITTLKTLFIAYCSEYTFTTPNFALDLQKTAFFKVLKQWHSFVWTNILDLGKITL